MNDYYRAELIRGPAGEGWPWKTVEGSREFELQFYAKKGTDQPLVGIQ